MKTIILISIFLLISCGDSLDKYQEQQEKEDVVIVVDNKTEEETVTENKTNKKKKKIRILEATVESLITPYAIYIGDDIEYCVTFKDNNRSVKWVKIKYEEPVKGNYVYTDKYFIQ